ncbi:DUF2730 domain-containing protein [Desulfovibrio sp. JY]|nr:DUF2730 domain-containing protein [Desulfovibrio sp. JY]
MQYWPIIGPLAQAVMLGVWWLMIGKFVTVESCATCRRQCRKEVAEDMGRLPSTTAFTDLAREVEGLRGDFKGQAAELRGLAEVFKRVEHPLSLLLEYHLGSNRRDRRE